MTDCFFTAAVKNLRKKEIFQIFVDVDNYENGHNSVVVKLKLSSVLSKNLELDSRVFLELASERAR